MEQSTRKKISALLRDHDELGARLILRKNAAVEEVETTILKKWKVYRVKYFAPTRPILFFIATNLQDQALTLTGNPEALTKVLESEKIRLENTDQVVEFTHLFFETSRPTSIAFQIIDSVDDISFLPKLNEAERLQISMLYQKWGKHIKKCML